MGDWQLLVRAVLPLFVLPLALLLYFGRKQIRLPWNGPSALLLFYGAIGAVGTIFSPEPLWSGYWSIAFVATVVVARQFPGRTDPIISARLLLWITWIATFIVAVIVAYQGRAAIFGAAPSGYGIISRELNGLSRSSGVARWAAVPGLVCMVRAFHTRKIWPMAIYLGVAGVFFFIVYRMQSRGAVFGAAASLIFILLIARRGRRYALPFAAVAIVTIFLIETPQVVSGRVGDYLRRGQSAQQFESMTGRTRAYEHGIKAFADAPIFGRGQWADRLTVGEHVHNSYLAAMLDGGVVGAAPYLASWIAGWILFLRLQKDRTRLCQQDRLALLECGAVMMFFAVRAIPETTTAEFSPDLLIMIAVYLYMETLWARRGSSRKFLFALVPEELLWRQMKTPAP